MKTYNDDKSLKEQAKSDIKWAFKWFIYITIFMMFVIQTALNLNMMNDIDALKQKVYGKNEFVLKKNEVKKMSPELIKQLPKNVKEEKSIW